MEVDRFFRRHKLSKGVYVDQDLFTKYGNQRLPRYTSYPTAPNFKKASGPRLHREWLSALQPDKPVSLYVHIPFCRSMCWYCGCHTKISRKDRPILSYLDALKCEISLVADQIGFLPNVGHVHFGGGTPTIISPEQFLGLSRLLREHFQLRNETEMAVEIDPRTLSAKMVDAMALSGVSRASLGVQSFDTDVQKAINRNQTFEQTETAVLALRDAGIHEINFDLIYGLPLQTRASCIESAKQALRLSPQRFSVFGYAHVPEFKKHQKMISRKQLPNGEERLEQAEAIAETLVDGGYERIGLDHYALPEDPLTRASEGGSLHRNFQGYTTDACETLIGFGPSAINRFDQGYIQNDVSIGSYCRQVEDGQLATGREYEITEEDRLRAAIIERLMCDFEVDLKNTCSNFGRDYRELVDNNSRLEEFADDGLVNLENGILRVTPGARFIIRTVASAFDAYLEQGGRKFSRAA